MHPRHRASRARTAAMPKAALAFATLDSVVLIGLSSLLALFGLWR